MHIGYGKVDNAVEHGLETQLSTIIEVGSVRGGGDYELVTMSTINQLTDLGRNILEKKRNKT
jgi:hypothetical protein